MTRVSIYQRSMGRKLRNLLAVPAISKIATMVGVNLLVPLTALAVAPLLARELGVEGRGIYTALTAPLLVAGVVGTFGLQDGLSQFISRRGFSPRRALKTASLAVLALSALTAGIMATLGFLLFDNHGQRLEYTLVLATVPVLIGHNLMIGIATGSGDIRGLNGTKLIPASVRAAAVIVLCVLTDMTPLTAALLLLATPALGILWQVGRILAARGPAGSTYVETTVAGSQSQLFRFSLATFPGVLAAMLMSRADQVIGLPLLGAVQLGHYAIAVTVAELPMMVATAGRSYLLGHHRGMGGHNGVARLAWGLLVANGAICLILMAIVPWGIPWIFGDAFRGAVIPCIILLLGTVCFTAMSLGSAILLNAGRPHSQSIAYAAAACVGITMLFLFSDLGAVGAAIASVLGYAVAAAICGALLWKSVKDRPPHPGSPHANSKSDCASIPAQDRSAAN